MGLKPWFIPGYQEETGFLRKFGDEEREISEETRFLSKYDRANRQRY